MKRIPTLRTWVKRAPLLRSALFAAENIAAAIRYPPKPRNEHPPRYFLSAMIRVRDEGRFLPEWLAHHRLLGVEHCFLYDNNSSDDLDNLLEPFLVRGWVTRIPWPTVPAAPACYEHFLRCFGTCSQWVAFFDADEFLIESSPGRCLDMLHRFAGLPALAVNWRYCGSSGHQRIPDGLVTAQFERTASRLDSHVKVIAQPRHILRNRNSHNFFYRRGRLARSCDGRRVFGSFIEPGAEMDLELRHYVYRSTEDYERKARGTFVDASGAAQRARTIERAQMEFHRHNDIIAPIAPATLAATARLLGTLGYASCLGAARSDPAPAPNFPCDC